MNQNRGPGGGDAEDLREKRGGSKIDAEGVVDSFLIHQFMRYIRSKTLTFLLISRTPPTFLLINSAAAASFDAGYRVTIRESSRHISKV